MKSVKVIHVIFNMIFQVSDFFIKVIRVGRAKNCTNTQGRICVSLVAMFGCIVALTILKVLKEYEC